MPNWLAETKSSATSCGHVTELVDGRHRPCKPSANGWSPIQTLKIEARQT
jgi:hypothetical protein